MRLIAGLIVAGLILTGCSTADSKDIRTSGIKADLRVTVTDHHRGAEVLATLRAGTLTYIKLGAGESIHAAGSGSSTELQRNKNFGVTTYTGQLDGDLNAGTEVGFDLRRDSDNESAPHSTVTLPERLQLLAPATNTTAARTAPITIRIDSAPTDLPTTVNWTGPCIQEGQLQLPSSTRTGQIPAGRIRQLATTPSPGKRTNTACTVRIKVYRQSVGALDPAFKDGTVTAEAQSYRDITSIP